MEKAGSHRLDVEDGLQPAVKRAKSDQDEVPSEQKKMKEKGLTPQQAREDRGLYEVEVSTNGEVDLHQHMNGCTKNPGHLNFIPVHKFAMQHLPAAYRDRDILDMVKAFADLTVRVCVRYVSDKRPDTWPDSDEPYPFSNCGGSDVLRTGSGWVQWVCRRSGLCRCPECQASSEPRRNWAFIAVTTVAHVVFDATESKHTTVELFYDDDQDKRSIRSLTAAWNGWFNFKEDRTEIAFATHDDVLLNRLDKLCARRNELQKKVSYKYKYPGRFFGNLGSGAIMLDLRAGIGFMAGYLQRFLNPQRESEEHVEDREIRIDHKLTIIVSHPHGCSKQVTVGEWTHKEEFEGDHATHTQYTYTTATCPGSSGAMVYILGDRVIPMYRYNNHAHSRRCLEDGLNMCGGGFDD